MAMHAQKQKKINPAGRQPSPAHDSFRSPHPFGTSLNDTNDTYSADTLPGFEIDSPVTPRSGHHFADVRVHAAVPETIQTKLTINQPGDVYEQEAERVAEQVIQMEAPGPSEAPPTSQDTRLGADDLLTRKEVSDTSVHETAGAPPLVDEVLSSGGGQPLDESTRSFMESRFGHDFSRVRVHTDERAAESARSVNALAYTAGQDVVFGRGQYEPGTNEGKKLLAHELTHVVQQKMESVSARSAPDGLSIGDPSDSLEQAADLAATSVVSGSPVPPEVVVDTETPLSIQRQVASAMPVEKAEGDEHTVSNAPGSQSIGALGNPPLPTVTGNDRQTLLDVMMVVQDIKPSDTASGLYVGKFQNQEITLSQPQLDHLYKNARAAIKDSLTKARIKADSAYEGYTYQTKVNEEQWIVSSIVKAVGYAKTFGKMKDPGPLLTSEVTKARESATVAETVLKSNDFTGAATLLADCETAAAKAQQLWQAYHQGIIEAGESTVTTLEYTRNASFITLGVLATFASGGAAAGLATGIATGAPIAATLGEAGVQAALGEKVDWTKVAIDVAINLLLARFGGKLADGILKTVASNPGMRSVERIALERMAHSILSHETSVVFTTIVNNVYGLLRGQPITWDQFTDQLVKSMADPKGLVIATAMGAMTAHAEAKYGSAGEGKVSDESSTQQRPASQEPSESPRSTSKSVHSQEEPSVPAKPFMAVSQPQSVPEQEAQVSPIASHVPTEEMPVASSLDRDFNEAIDEALQKIESGGETGGFQSDRVDLSKDNSPIRPGISISVRRPSSGHPWEIHESTKVLEVGAGPKDTDTGLPPETTPLGSKPPGESLIERQRTDMRVREGVTYLDAEQPVPTDLKGMFETVQINNPRGYQANIEHLGEALCPGGRIIVQGQGYANPDFKRLLRPALKMARGELPLPKGITKVIVEGPSESTPILGGPYYRTEPVEEEYIEVHPNARIIYEKE